MNTEIPSNPTDKEFKKIDSSYIGKTRTVIKRAKRVYNLFKNHIITTEK